MIRRDFFDASLLLTLILAVLPKPVAEALLREWGMHPEKLTGVLGGIMRLTFPDQNGEIETIDLGARIL